MSGVVLVSRREKNRSRKHIKRESEKRGKEGSGGELSLWWTMFGAGQKSRYDDVRPRKV